MVLLYGAFPFSRNLLWNGVLKINVYLNNIKFTVSYLYNYFDQKNCDKQYIFKETIAYDNIILNHANVFNNPRRPFKINWNP